MNRDRKENRRPSCIVWPLRLFAGFAIIVAFTLLLYRPDRPVDMIVAGTSSEPAFVVQIIRPRSGLPLGGLLPPELFKVDAELGFDSKSSGASIGSVTPQRIELIADDWELVLVVAEDGQVSSDTEVVFSLIFEDRLTRVRCQPADPPVGSMTVIELKELGELCGNFHIEVGQCHDAETGKSLGWPSEPLILHGSFDRLPLDGDGE